MFVGYKMLAPQKLLNFNLSYFVLKLCKCLSLRSEAYIIYEDRWSRFMNLSDIYLLSYLIQINNDEK